MLEIGLHVANEMMLYEGSIDELRALAIFLSENNTPGYQHLFDFIKLHSSHYARDIHEHSKVLPETVAQLNQEAQKVRATLGLTQNHVRDAHRRQLCARGGFWEMRHYFGLLPGVIDDIAQNQPDHIVCATLSGSVLGEYISQDLKMRHGLQIPVDHIVYKRQDSLPIQGQVPLNFSPGGDNILIVEDVVQEPFTTRTTLDVLRQFRPTITLSLFALEIDPAPLAQEALVYYNTVFTFETE
ncbi:hypothetical protein A2368_03425 [Candidatus Collierbacteria bacterium RIFOXYB1_FULL_49_13]|uniref:Phosphoribosyltransferase domain-containing protein n=1 Tax=Candidatus Collierbacteria bacterium RIFOXYB1_FULL_49_13 TaxID=1817728 RepID=A0A1F5FIM8_9BACT|nr:MAG: hypothetical protein A2368_03425 [Candidatus Collierbacteria bacterium RIFOXYB1_FULL_49_13]